MRITPLLLAPTLALCGTFSGTVVSLDGTPIVGAVIKAGTDSVTTTPNGSWTLARAVGIASSSGKTVPVTSHLTVQNGHPRISFGGMDISGRSLSLPRAESRGGTEGQPTITARSTAARDTLTVYWKGKRLTVLAVPSDTGNLTFRIDTAWKDDAGIPWNPAVTYGSLYDARDGQTYRTVTIGMQTWMAENLAYGVDSSRAYKDSSSYAALYGLLYSWATAMDLSPACDSTLCLSVPQDQVRGVCPSKWHMPSDSSWGTLAMMTGGRAGAGLILKTQGNWYSYQTAPGNGNDSLGFRGLANGYYSDQFLESTLFATWWSANETSRSTATGQTMNSMLSSLAHGVERKMTKAGVRCIKDTP